MDLQIYKKRIPKKEVNVNIPISGAKNAAVAIIPAALLTDEEVTLNNIPDISDVNILVDIIKELGHNITFESNKIVIKRNNKANWVLPDSVNKLRGSYYFIGTYLGYLGKIALKSCGGCDLGERSTNYHNEGFKKLKAKYKFKNGYDIYNVRKIKGTNITLPTPSVGATINLVLASVLGKGVTTITNYAKEIEVIDVCNFLNSMGANISGFQKDTLIITGVKKLHGINYTIIPDRIEAGTYLALGCLLENTTLKVTNINPIYLDSFLDVLEKIGHNITKENNSITVTKGNNLQPVSIETAPYPGFPTDLGPIITVLLTQIDGESTLKENIFSNRFSHVAELNKMGCSIVIKDKTIVVSGKTFLHGEKVFGHDLRCSAALVLASVIATNKTTISNIETLARGYENYLKKLSLLKIKYEKI